MAPRAPEGTPKRRDKQNGVSAVVIDGSAVVIDGSAVVMDGSAVVPVLPVDSSLAGANKARKRGARGSGDGAAGKDVHSNSDGSMESEDAADGESPSRHGAGEGSQADPKSQHARKKQAAGMKSNVPKTVVNPLSALSRREFKKLHDKMAEGVGTLASSVQFRSIDDHVNTIMEAVAHIVDDTYETYGNTAR